ncbi:MAG: nitronate monooxygenase [Elusimicrobiota bacterium]
MPPAPAAWKDLDILVGGMGADISSIELVAAAANHPGGRISGSLSATALADIYVHRLQLGDANNEIREAFTACGGAIPALAGDIDRLYTNYHIPGGKIVTVPFRGISIGGMTPPRDVQILTIAATFAHIWRTKKAAPDRPIGINFLRKIERPLLYGLYGAMLAGADWVVMGAGDISDIPDIMNRLSRNEPAELSVQVATVPGGTYRIRFDPKELVGDSLPPPARPAFFAIVSSHLQAAGLAASDKTRPEGFVIEAPPAGGHNAPPLKKKLDERGHYMYGPEDDADLDAVAALGLPFWLAGGYGHPEQPDADRGSRRRQVGTLFALANESGMYPNLRRNVLQLIWKRQLEVVTDPCASPSTYPFKVALVPGTIGDPAVYEARPRRCNVGHLRGYRPMGRRAVGLCSADDPAIFKKSGGALWRTKGAMCLCNGLLAACGVGQPGEKPVVTLGDISPVRELQRRLRRTEYSVAEAIAFLRGETAVKIP